MSINQDHIGDANKMVSSIEFLVKEINQIIDFIPMNKWDEIRIVVEQAKAMHKEEVLNFDSLLDKHQINAYKNNTIYLSREEFYNETFGE